MSNERIDLTQFEGMIEGPWHFCLPHHAEEDTYYGDAVMRGEGDRVNGPIILKEYAFENGIVGNSTELRAIESVPDLIAELKRCYEVMNEVILRAMDAREEEASDIIIHGDEAYVNVDEIIYLFSKSDTDSALDSKASE